MKNKEWVYPTIMIRMAYLLAGDFGSVGENEQYFRGLSFSHGFGVYKSQCMEQSIKGNMLQLGICCCVRCLRMVTD